METEQALTASVQVYPVKVRCMEVAMFAACVIHGYHSRRDVLQSLMSVPLVVLLHEEVATSSGVCLLMGMCSSRHPLPWQ